MALLHISNVKISGMAGAVPDNVVHNKDYDWISEKDREMLMQTTGVVERRFTKRGVCTSDMGIFAAEKLIAEMGWDKAEIELLVFVSQCRDFILPNTACIIQDRMGLSKNCMAFDVPLGCSGYVYGLSIAASLMSNGTIKKGMLIVGDVSSYDLSYQDKSVYPLFGDGVAVTMLEYTGDSNDVMHFLHQTDGKGYDSIIIPDGGNRNDITDETFVPVQYEEGIIRTRKNLFLDGMKVFEFTIREVAKTVKQLLKHLEQTTDNYDYYVFHQANKLMNETVRKQLKVAPEKVPYSIGKYGNTSSASIPLTIISELNEEARTQNKNYMLAGFGVGLSWGAASINISNIVCPPVYQHHAE